MVAVLLALLVAQDPREVSVPGKRDILAPRPYRRDDLHHQNLARRAGGGRESDEALLSALDWLSRHQQPDGSWDGSIETTGLALLAFLDAGFTTWAQEDCRTDYGSRSGSAAAFRPVSAHARVVRRAITFLIQSQNAGGFIGVRGSPEALRAHAVAARALSEAYGWTLLLPLREPAEKAIDALLKEPIPADDAVVGWSALAFQSARRNGVPRPAAPEAPLRLTPRPPGPFSLRRAGIEIVLWDRSRKGGSDPDPEELRSRVGGPSTWDRDTVDPEAWFWMTIGMRRYDLGGHLWKKWYPELLTTLLRHQQRDPEGQRGSWEPFGRSRAAATAFHALSLAAPYEVPVFWGR